jgi:hypothetical protein
MSAVALWLWGYITLASILIIPAWGRSAREIAQEVDTWHELLRCKPWLVAASLCVHAVGVGSGSAYRLWDGLARGVYQTGTQAFVLFLTLTLLATAKTVLLWAGALREEGQSAHWTWWIGVYFAIVWGVAVPVLAVPR